MNVADAVAEWLPDRCSPRFAALVETWRPTPATARAAALLLWASWPILALGAPAVPPFLLLAIAFSVGFLVLAVQSRLAGRAAGTPPAKPSSATAPGLPALVGSQVLWLLALRLFFPGDAAGAAPWPILGALGGGTVPQSAAWIFLLAGVLCWAASARARRCLPTAQVEPMGRLCALAAPLSLLLHLCLEPRVPLDAASLLTAGGLGLGPLGLAWSLWSEAGCRVGGAVSAGRRRGAGGR